MDYDCCDCFGTQLNLSIETEGDDDGDDRSDCFDGGLMIDFEIGFP